MARKVKAFLRQMPHDAALEPAKVKDEPAPEGMTYMGEIEIFTGEVFVWTQPDGGRCFGFLPTAKN